MKKRKTKALIIVICILLSAAAAVTAVYFARRKMPVSVTTESPTESTADQTATESTTNGSTEESSTSDGETEQYNITDSPEIGGAYEPTSFEKSLFDRINAEREKHGKTKLEYNSVLHTLAKIRAEEAVKLWSHSRPDGRSPSSVFSDNSLSFSAFGECLARGTDETDGGAALLVEGLLKSENQTEIIFSDEYSHFAVAVSENSDGTVSAAVLFCNP